MGGLARPPQLMRLISCSWCEACKEQPLESGAGCPNVQITLRVSLDLVAGPEHIFSILESALPDVRAMRQHYPDAVVLPGATALPPPSDRRRKKIKIPTSLPAIGFRLARGVAHHGIGTLDIKRRRFPMEPDEVRRQLKLKGSKRKTCILTRFGDDPIAIFCDPVRP